MVSRGHHSDADDNADKKVRFEWLLLGFMTKELLPQKGPGPTPCHTKYQQRRFRNPAHAFTRRHFICAIHDHRQHIDQQQPHHHWIRGKNAADRSKNQE